VGMLLILVFSAVASFAQVFIVYTRVFLKVAVLWQTGEIYRKEQACSFMSFIQL